MPVNHNASARLATPVRRALVSVALLLASTSALALDGVRWPVSNASTRNDPLAALRWPNGGWTCVLSRDVASTPRAAQTALALLDRRVAESPRDARSHAARAVALRLLERTDEARRALDRAQAIDAAVLDDADVALTHAFLLARAGQYEEAVGVARRVLPRLSGALDTRVEASVEVARWSLRRGPPGVAAALSILREAASVQPPDPALRAALAFALVLDGRQTEAREVARSGAVPSATPSAARPPRGTLTPELVDAAVGVALSLSDHAYDAVTVLEASVAAGGAAGVPLAFRPAVAGALQSARATPRPPPPPPPRPESRRQWEEEDYD
jgi:tetratricopeptide (TPR) repeat protein